MLLDPRLCKAVSAASTAHDTRFALGGVQVRPDGLIEATDGHILLQGRVTTPMPDADYPQVRRLPDDSPAAAVLIPSDVLARAIAGAPKKSTIPVLTMLALRQNGGAPMLASGPLGSAAVVTVPVTDGAMFPRTDRIMREATPDDRRVVFGVPVLEAMIKAAKAIGARTIALSIPEPTRAGLTAEGAGVVSVDTSIRLDITTVGGDLSIAGVAMPCRP